MTPDPQSRELLGRLARSCSALARAGQVLSGVTSSSQAGEAIRRAAALLDDDARASGFPQIIAAAKECRRMMESPTAFDMVKVCRQLATSMARQASTLASEVQTYSTRGVPAAAARPSPTAAPAPEPVPEVDAAPAEEPAPAAAGGDAAAGEPLGEPEAVAEGGGVGPAAAEIAEALAARLAEVTIAVRQQEQAAVRTALEQDWRFALTEDGVVIDTRSNRMWAVQISPPGTYIAAQTWVAGCGLGGYADWRLPRPDELQFLLSGGGLEFLRSISALSPAKGAAEATLLWTARSRRRWFLLRRDVTTVQVQTAVLGLCRAARSDLHALAVR